MMNPVKSPYAARVYAYGPPASGTRRASRAKTSARTRAPTAVSSQPASARPPNCASEAGSVKMPTPITLPTTSAMQAQRPSDALLSAVSGATSVAAIRRSPSVRDATCSVRSSGRVGLDNRAGRAGQDALDVGKRADRGPSASGRDEVAGGFDLG